ncbi:SDR family oxidoreductase [Streptomyces sp. NPDC001678]|uniref:SDR family oxidoreductase n=1 Tax=Streptomyces sp. NPDC001678 TaxID=3364599 RepID=UPI003681B8BE
MADLDLPAAAEVVTADLTRPDTLRPALDGVRRVFLYAPPASAEGFATMAAEADLEGVVLPWTPVRPLVLASNSLGWAESIRPSGLVRLVRPDAVTAPVHERDVAAVAVTALGIGTRHGRHRRGKRAAPVPDAWAPQRTSRTPRPAHQSGTPPARGGP